VADVLLFLTGNTAGRWRDGGPGAAARADAGLLVDRQHQRVVGRDQVQPAHIGGAFPELWHLPAGDPAAHPVGLEVEICQDPADLRGGDADVGQGVGELAVAPVAGRIRRRLGDGGEQPQPLVVA
jgi:hypothetical protein